MGTKGAIGDYSSGPVAACARGFFFGFISSSFLLNSDTFLLLSYTLPERKDIRILDLWHKRKAWTTRLFPFPEFSLKCEADQSLILTAQTLNCNGTILKDRCTEEGHQST